MNRTSTFPLRTALVAAGLAWAVSSAAQTFPAGPVKLVVGVPPGSAPDVVSRTLAQAMEPLLGQPVLVENRLGAGGTLAVSAVAAAPADGYTLNVSGCSGDSVTHAFVAQGRAALVLFKDLTPVGQLMRDHWLVLVPASSPVTNLKDLAASARTQPAAYPSQGEGSSPHLQGERLARALGFKALHVPYKDSAAADLVSGRLSYAVQGSASVTELVKSGKLRALAVLSRDRLPALPDVPTAHEAGLPGYVFNGGVCLWAPGATPRAVVDRLNGALLAAHAQPKVRERFTALGVDPTPLDVDSTLRYVADFAAEGARLRADVFGSAR